MFPLAIYTETGRERFKFVDSAVRGGFMEVPRRERGGERFPGTDACGWDDAVQ